MPIDAYYQRLAKFPPEVIIAWVQSRGISFFNEELLAIERMLDADRRAQIAAEIERLMKERTRVEQRKRDAPGLARFEI